MCLRRTRLRPAGLAGPVCSKSQADSLHDNSNVRNRAMKCAQYSGETKHSLWLITGPTSTACMMQCFSCCCCCSGLGAAMAIVTTCADNPLPTIIGAQTCRQCCCQRRLRDCCSPHCRLLADLLPIVVIFVGQGVASGTRAGCADGV
jgi:hypothetical protein